MKELEREVRELRRANEILEAAASWPRVQFKGMSFPKIGVPPELVSYVKAGRVY